MICGCECWFWIWNAAAIFRGETKENKYELKGSQAQDRDSKLGLHKCVTVVSRVSPHSVDTSSNGSAIFPEKCPGTHRVTQNSVRGVLHTDVRKRVPEHRSGLRPSENFRNGVLAPSQKYPWALVFMTHASKSIEWRLCFMLGNRTSWWSG
jgi:hypothetical protein